MSELNPELRRATPSKALDARFGDVPARAAETDRSTGRPLLGPIGADEVIVVPVAENDDDLIGRPQIHGGVTGASQSSENSALEAGEAVGGHARHLDRHAVPHLANVSESIERWRSVRHHEGRYEVSNLGRVRSLARIDARGHHQEGQILRPSIRADGYVQVRLYNAVVGATKKVHRLVLEAFTGPRPDGMEACHANGDRSDNRAGNLRWDTVRENANDRISHHPTCRRRHRLEGPNLLIVGAARKRRCRACARERVRANEQRRASDEAAANQTYAEIMGEAA